MNTNTAQIPLDLKRFSCRGEFLSDFIESYFEPAHLRDVCTKKHLIANFQMASRNGFESTHDLIGVNPRELWVQDVTQRRDRLNIDSIGIIRFHRLIKFPLSNQVSKKVVALLTVFQDLTCHLHCSRVFQLYQGFYPTKKAIQKTLEHFKLGKYFCSQPTHKEMQVLLSMRDDSRRKIVAKKLECSVPTVNNNVASIQNKLTSCTLHDVLLKLPAIPENKQNLYVYI